MYLIILLLFLCENAIYANAFTRCCQGENILVNHTCSDGSNVTSLPCKDVVFFGPKRDPPVILEIDPDDHLIVTDEEETGYLTVDPDKYCMTKDGVNDTELALVCAENEEAIEKNTEGLAFFWIKFVCNLISILFLLALLIVYIFLPELHDIEGKCILNMIASLLVPYIVYLFLPITIHIEPNPCDINSFIYCTGYLCFINWLSILSFHLWRITIRPIFETTMRWFLIYVCYGYAVPIVLLITALIMHHSQETELTIGEVQCLFEGNAVVWSYFYGPSMIMLLISLGLQLWVAKKLWRDIDRRDKSQTVVRLRKKTLMYMHLLLIVGLVQVLDMVSYIFINVDDYLDYMWEVSDCRNLTIGGVIFFILVVLRNKVLKALAKKGLCCIKFPKSWEKLKDEESEEIHCEETSLTRDSTGL